jgi:predicted neuraminidase
MMRRGKRYACVKSMRKLVAVCLLSGFLLVSEGCAQAPGEFVADPMPTVSCHASTVVELTDGDLMVAWFGGTDEGAKDVAIWSGRYQNGHWQKPVELAREPNIATYNPVLFHSKDGVLWFYYKFGPNPSEWSAARRYSRDEGRTWSTTEYLPAGLLGPIRGKPLILDDGTILAGSSVESYRSWAAWIERSTDNAKTWTKHGPIALETPAPAGKGNHGIIQPVLLPLDETGSRLRMLARSTGDIGRISVAESADGGITWTKARPSALLNPNAGFDGVRLRDGRYVLLYNDSSTARTPLVLALSKDAEHWTRFLAVENAPGEYSYPALIQAANGDLVMTYTWNRKKIRMVRLKLSSVK